MLDELGEDLAVIFVESQGADARRAESFAYQKGWMGRGAAWTRERPASTGLGYLPSFILLDIDGRVLMKGNTAAMKSAIEDAVEEQIDLADELPEGFERDFKKAWQALREGEWAEASERIEKEAEDEELAAQAAQLRERLTAALEREVATIEARVERGLLVEALERSERLVDAAEGLEEWHRRGVELVERLESEEFEAEMDAAEAFEKLYEKVCEDGIEDHARKLEKFAEKHPGTRAAERALHLFRLV